VPKTAWYAVVADPEGNIFAVWQPDPVAFPPPQPDWRTDLLSPLERWLGPRTTGLRQQL